MLVASRWRGRGARATEGAPKDRRGRKGSCPREAIRFKDPERIAVGPKREKNEGKKNVAHINKNKSQVEESSLAGPPGDVPEEARPGYHRPGGTD